MQLKLSKYKFLIIFLICSLVLSYFYQLKVIKTKSIKLQIARCVNVNPDLIAYKKSFIKSTLVLNSGSDTAADEYMQNFVNYIKGAGIYAPKEKEWVLEMSKFQESLSYRFFAPWFLKETQKYALLMYQAYGDEAQLIGDVFEKKIDLEDYKKKFAEARDRRDKNSENLRNAMDKVALINDFRKKFVYFDLPKECNSENMSIPNTTGTMDSSPKKIPDAESSG